MRVDPYVGVRYFSAFDMAENGFLIKSFLDRQGDLLGHLEIFASLGMIPDPMIMFFRHNQRVSRRARIDR